VKLKNLIKVGFARLGLIFINGGYSMKFRKVALTTICMSLVLLTATVASADVKARVLEVKGKVYYRSNNTGDYQALSSGVTLSAGDYIKTKDRSKTKIKFSDGTEYVVPARTSMSVDALYKLAKKGNKRGGIMGVWSKIRSFMHKKDSGSGTFGVAGVRGRMQEGAKLPTGQQREAVEPTTPPTEKELMGQIRQLRKFLKSAENDEQKAEALYFIGECYQLLANIAYQETVGFADEDSDLHRQAQEKLLQGANNPE
jgi:hypothetical protein